MVACEATSGGCWPRRHSRDCCEPWRRHVSVASGALMRCGGERVFPEIEFLQAAFYLALNVCRSSARIMLSLAESSSESATSKRTGRD